jgi:hydroxyacyl-ACP dehydratase HTD2-like protein with hotdog domain
MIYSDPSADGRVVAQVPVGQRAQAPAVGDPVGPAEFEPTLTRLVQFASAMWEYQRIHFDYAWARREGLEAPIVHGPLLGNYLAQVAHDWAGTGGELRRLRWRNQHVAVVDRTLTVEGEVTQVDEQPQGGWLCECDLRIRGAEDVRILSAQATVYVPGR